MPFIYKGRAYPDSSTVIDAGGRHFLCHVGGWTEIRSPAEVSEIKNGRMPAWASLPVVADEDAAVAASVSDAIETAGDEDGRESRREMVASLRALAAADGSENKGWFAEHERRARLGIPNSLKAKAYKARCQADARAKLDRLSL
jgi:hypothetical protein